MAYAIIEDSGTQTKVEPGDKFEIDLRDLADGHARLATPNECSSLLFPITQQSPTVSTVLNRTSREIPLVILELASPI